MRSVAWLGSALMLVVSCLACATPTEPQREPSGSCMDEFETLRSSPAPYTPIPVEGTDHRTECGPLDIVVAGDYDTRVSDVETLVSTVTFHGGDLPDQARFLSVAMLKHLEHPDGSRFRVGFNVTPGTYRGDGSYRLTEDGIEVPGDVGQVRTPLGASAFVEVIAPPGTEPPIVRFEKLGQPCSLEVESAGSKGSLHCPELVASDGRAVELRWSWDTVRDPADP